MPRISVNVEADTREGCWHTDTYQTCCMLAMPVITGMKGPRAAVMMRKYVDKARVVS